MKLYTQLAFSSPRKESAAVFAYTYVRQARLHAPRRVVDDVMAKTHCSESPRAYKQEHE